MLDLVQPVEMHVQEKLKEHILHTFGFSIDNDWIQKLPAVMWCMVKETKNKKQKNRPKKEKGFRNFLWWVFPGQKIMTKVKGVGGISWWAVRHPQQKYIHTSHC